MAVPLPGSSPGVMCAGGPSRAAAGEPAWLPPDPHMGGLARREMAAVTAGACTGCFLKETLR